MYGRILPQEKVWSGRRSYRPGVLMPWPLAIAVSGGLALSTGANLYAA